MERPARREGDATRGKRQQMDSSPEDHELTIVPARSNDSALFCAQLIDALDEAISLSPHGVISKGAVRSLLILRQAIAGGRLPVASQK